MGVDVDKVRMNDDDRMNVGGVMIRVRTISSSNES